MTIHFIKDFEKFVEGLSYILKPGGRFVFTTAHPLRKLGMLDAKGKQKKYAVSLEDLINKYRKYLEVSEGITFNVWTGKNDLKIFNAPLSVYINTMSENNLLVDKLVEPKTDVVLNDVEDVTPVSSPIPIVYAIGVKKTK